MKATKDVFVARFNSVEKLTCTSRAALSVSAFRFRLCSSFFSCRSASVSSRIFFLSATKPQRGKRNRTLLQTLNSKKVPVLYSRPKAQPLRRKLSLRNSILEKVSKPYRSIFERRKYGKAARTTALADSCKPEVTLRGLEATLFERT